MPECITTLLNVMGGCGFSFVHPDGSSTQGPVPARDRLKAGRILLKVPPPAPRASRAPPCGAMR
jgi:hypothetical protein